MNATLDLPAIRDFTEQLTEQIRRCDNGEGMFCSTLDAKIRHYVKLCQGLRALIGEWAEGVFTGRSVFNPAAERLLMELAKQLLERAHETAAQGRAMGGECFALEELDALHYQIADFAYLLQHWRSPQLAVGPAPKSKISEAAARQISESLGKLDTTR